MLSTLLKLKLKQAAGNVGFQAVLRFLAPNLLVGFFLALTNASGPISGLRTPVSDFTLRLGLVSGGVAMFTLLAETRKLFFIGGDLENFYFVQPTKISRFASLLAMITLDLAIVFSIAIPSFIISFSNANIFVAIISTCIVVACISLVFYLLIVLGIAFLPQRAADLSVTILQIVMVLMLLVVFQLPFVASMFHGPRVLLIFCFFLPVFILVFLVFPIQEKLISKLNQRHFGTRLDFVAVVERIKRFVIVRSNEEEAGFIFLLSNMFRNPSLALSTIGTAATPVIVAVYWSMRGVPFVSFDTAPVFFHAQSLAALVSLVISGIFVYYYLSQNILSSKDHEAKWMISEVMLADDMHHGFDAGRFMLGFRRSFLLTVHVPMSILIFFVIITKESFVPALISTLTFYLLTHFAASWFFVMQKHLPFSLPFTQIGAIELLSIVSMFVYSFLIVIVLYFCYGSLQSILIMDFFAFVLINLLGFSSVRVVNKRVKFV